MGKNAAKQRQLSEKQKAALKAHAFKPGQSGNPAGNDPALERTREGAALLDKYRVRTAKELKAMKTEELPVQDAIIIRRLIAAYERECTARSEVLERLLGKIPQSITGPNGEAVLPVITLSQKASE
jgi:hypothetical protein